MKIRNVRLWMLCLALVAALCGCHCGTRFLEDSKLSVEALVPPPAQTRGATTVQAAAFLDDDRALVGFIFDTDNDGLLTGADRSAIWLVDIAEKRWVELTDPSQASCFLPDSGFAIGTRPILDGRVLFHRISSDTDNDGILTTADAVEIWSMTPDGKDQRPIITRDNPRLADVSPEAGRIIYSVRNSSMGRDFFLATSEGGSPTRIPVPNMASASFSPRDSRFVAAVETQQGMSLELIDPDDGYSRKNLLEGSSLLYFAPRWSEDGGRVLAHDSRDVDGDGRVALDEPGEIVVINVVTGDIEQLTLAPGLGNRLGGVWASQGRALFMSADPTTGEHFRGIRLLAAPMGANEAAELYCCFNSALRVFLAANPSRDRFLVDLWTDTNSDGRIDGADRSTLGLITAL